MAHGPGETWAQIVKYSIIANGTALTLSLSAIGKTPLIQLSPSVGKVPVWCFFLGLLLGGLHLLFSFFYETERERARWEGKLAGINDEAIKLRDEALKVGALEELLTIRQRQAQLDTYAELLEAPPKGADGVLRNLQEWTLWGSHLLFFLGVFLVIWSI